MMFRYLITLTMIMVWGTSSWISIRGLSAFLPQGGLVIYVMGAGLELGKLLVIIHIHSSWGRAKIVQRGYYSLLVGILVVLTASEVLGYLSLCHSTATAGIKTAGVELAELDLEKTFLMDQIRTIDETMDGLPEGYVTKRLAVRESTGYEAKVGRVLAITRRQAELATATAGHSGTAGGPVYAAAGIMGIDPAKMATFFIGVLVLVLEMLSAGLAVAVSSAWSDLADSETGPGPETEATPEKDVGARCLVPVVDDTPAPDADLTAKGSPNFLKLRAIIDTHGFTVSELMKITGRKKKDTVMAWLDDSGPIPDKALRALAKYIQGKPKLRAVG